MFELLPALGVLELSALGGVGAVAVGFVLELSPGGGVDAAAVGWCWSRRRHCWFGVGAVAVGSVMKLSGCWSFRRLVGAGAFGVWWCWSCCPWVGVVAVSGSQR
jgi:hypothetical protein